MNVEILQTDDVRRLCDRAELHGEWLGVKPGLTHEFEELFASHEQLRARLERATSTAAARPRRVTLAGVGS